MKGSEPLGCPTASAPGGGFAVDISSSTGAVPRIPLPLGEPLGDVGRRS